MNFDALIIKVASRCNLNCSYCFMYNLGDTTYKNQPKFMSSDTVDAILQKTKIYIQQFQKKQFSFIFHGGEPLLATKEFYKSFISKANQLVKELNEVTFFYDIQTNGVLIDEEWLNLFKHLNIHPSISIDGTEKAHDMFRVDHQGKGSYHKVLQNTQLIKKHSNILDIACVINVNEKPIDVYESFKRMKADTVNFLIPDYTHDNFPFNKQETRMADWLIEMFDIWVNDTNRYRIPMFIGFMNRFMRIHESERNESTVLVIETNGEIEAVDSLKACGNGFTKTGLTIKHHNFNDIKTSPLGNLYFGNYTTKLCYQCSECPLQEICTGGRLVHRYSKKNGFNNPSVYCNDLISFIAHVQHYFIECYPELHASENIEAIVPKEIQAYLSSLHPTSHTLPIHQELEAFSS